MENREIELVDYVRIIWKRRWLILGGTFTCIGIGLILYFLLPKSYETSTVIKIGTVWRKPIEDPYSLLEILKSDSFLYDLIKKTEMKLNIGQLRKSKRIEVLLLNQEAPPTPLLVSIKVRSNTPQEAVKIANFIAQTIIDNHKSKFNEQMVENVAYENLLEEQIKKNGNFAKIFDAYETLHEVKMKNSHPAFSEQTKVIVPPFSPQEHSNPDIKFYTVIVGISSLMVFLMIAFLLESFDEINQSKKFHNSP